MTRQEYFVVVLSAATHICQPIYFTNRWLLNRNLFSRRERTSIVISAQLPKTCRSALKHVVNDDCIKNHLQSYYLTQSIFDGQCIFYVGFISSQINVLIESMMFQGPSSSSSSMPTAAAVAAAAATAKIQAMDAVATNAVIGKLWP